MGPVDTMIPDLLRASCGTANLNLEHGHEAEPRAASTSLTAGDTGRLRRRGLGSGFRNTARPLWGERPVVAFTVLLESGARVRSQRAGLRPASRHQGEDRTQASVPQESCALTREPPPSDAVRTSARFHRIPRKIYRNLRWRQRKFRLPDIGPFRVTRSARVQCPFRLRDPCSSRIPGRSFLLRWVLYRLGRDMIWHFFRFQ